MDNLIRNGKNGGKRGYIPVSTTPGLTEIDVMEGFSFVNVITR